MHFSKLYVWKITFINMDINTVIIIIETRADVYETLCPQHILVSKDNLETKCQG